jgi:hypothetical protein
MANKDKASSRVWQKRTFALDQLILSCEMLIKESQRLLKKIETEGLDSNYSINSDVLRWARKAHSACYSLSILKEAQVYIDADYGRIEELGKQNSDGKKEEDQDPETTQLASSASVPPTGSRGT